LQQWGDVKITGHAVPSVQFDRRISEHTMVGRFAWRAIQWLETHHSDHAAWLGCSVLIVVNKSKSDVAA